MIKSLVLISVKGVVDKNFTLRNVGLPKCLWILCDVQESEYRY